MQTRRKIASMANIKQGYYQLAFYMESKYDELRISNYSNHEPLYGSYSAATELELRMQNVDKIHQDIVQVYVNQFHQQLPKKVYFMICLFCDFMGSGFIIYSLNVSKSRCLEKVFFVNIPALQ